MAADGRATVQFCASAREVVAHLDRGALAGVVLELSTAVRRELPSIIVALERRPVPLVLRFSLRDASAVRDVVGQQHRLSMLRISLRDVESLVVDVERLLSMEASMPARLAILKRVHGTVIGPALRIVTAAAVVGRRSASVRELAKASGMSVRTLQVRCHTARMLSPQPMLGWMLTLYATWDVTRCGRSGQAVANAAGLNSAKALSDRIERVTGMRLRECCRLGYDDLLERFSGALPATMRQPDRDHGRTA